MAVFITDMVNLRLCWQVCNYCDNCLVLLVAFAACDEIYEVMWIIRRHFF